MAWPPGTAHDAPRIDLAARRACSGEDPPGGAWSRIPAAHPVAHARALACNSWGVFGAAGTLALGPSPPGALGTASAASPGLPFRTSPAARTPAPRRRILRTPQRPPGDVSDSRGCRAPRTAGAGGDCPEGREDGRPGAVRPPSPHSRVSPPCAPNFASRGGRPATAPRMRGSARGGGGSTGGRLALLWTVPLTLSGLFGVAGGASSLGAHHIHHFHGSTKHHPVPIAIYRSPASLRGGHGGSPRGSPTSLRAPFCSVHWTLARISGISGRRARDRALQPLGALETIEKGPGRSWGKRGREGHPSLDPPPCSRAPIASQGLEGAAGQGGLHDLLSTMRVPPRSSSRAFPTRGVRGMGTGDRGPSGQPSSAAAQQEPGAWPLRPHSPRPGRTGACAGGSPSAASRAPLSLACSEQRKMRLQPFSLRPGAARRKVPHSFLLRV